MKRKICFFDIDGTIWDVGNYIPASTVQAIHALQKNGHQAFLNTGRGRGYVRRPELLAIGFDGIVSGAGTMIEYRGETVLYHRIGQELADLAVSTVKRCGMRPILEGRQYLYLDYEDFREDPYGRKVISEMDEDLRSIRGEWGRWEMSKLSCATEAADMEECRRVLEPHFHFVVHNSAVVEMVPLGFGKGRGVERVCELLGAELEDTIAFGDSANDLDMFEACGCSVAMGSGFEAAKQAADYVTTPLREDGIWNACVKLGLIGPEG